MVVRYFLCVWSLEKRACNCSNLFCCFLYSNNGATAITVPMMLAMGVHPAVVSATSSAMILFTSLAATTSFFVFGLLLFDFAVVGFVVGFIAASLGQILMRQARQARSASGRDFERNSYTAFAIGGVILVSALLMTIEVRTKIDCYKFANVSFQYFSRMSFIVCIFYCRTTRRSGWAVRWTSVLIFNVSAIIC